MLCVCDCQFCINCQRCYLEDKLYFDTCIFRWLHLRWRKNHRVFCSVTRSLFPFIAFDKVFFHLQRFLLRPDWKSFFKLIWSANSMTETNQIVLEIRILQYFCIGNGLLNQTYFNIFFLRRKWKDFSRSFKNKSNEIQTNRFGIISLEIGWKQSIFGYIFKWIGTKTRGTHKISHRHMKTQYHPVIAAEWVCTIDGRPFTKFLVKFDRSCDVHLTK